MPFQPLSLTVLNDTDVPKSLVFDEARVGLGKSDTNLLNVDSVFLSRKHGVFEFREDAWVYEDLDSRNKTRLIRNGRMHWLSPELEIKMMNILDGDELHIGDTLVIRVGPKSDDGAMGIEQLVLGQSNPTDALLALGQPIGVSSGLKLLFETVRLVSKCSTEDEVLGVVAQAAFEAVPKLSHVFLFRKHPKSGEWSVQWSSSRLPREHEEDPPFSRSLLEEAYQENEAKLFTTQKGKRDASGSAYRARISSSVCAPLSGLHGNLGVLQADCRDPNTHLDDISLHLLTLLAEQAAVMLDRLEITANIEGMFEGFVQASIRAIESRDPSTAGHSARVAQYSLHLARSVDGIKEGYFTDTHFTDADYRTLRYAALLHDFGKIGVPSEFLLKATKLAPKALSEISDRFQIARMEVRARYAEARFNMLLESPDPSVLFLKDLKGREEAELEFLTREKRWLFKQMSGRRIQEVGYPRLKRLTEVWHTSQVRLLKPKQMAAMLGCKGTLTQAERTVVERHAFWTRCYLDEIPWSKELARVPEIAGDHHEKLNGKGYPEGQFADSISMEVRILTLSDIYDALTASDRSYKKAFPPSKALDILQDEVKRGAVDPNLLDLFRTVWDETPSLK